MCPAWPTPRRPHFNRTSAERIRRGRTDDRLAIELRCGPISGRSACPPIPAWPRHAELPTGCGTLVLLDRVWGINCRSTFLAHLAGSYKPGSLRYAAFWPPGPTRQPRLRCTLKATPSLRQVPRHRPPLSPILRTPATLLPPRRSPRPRRHSLRQARSNPPQLQPRRLHRLAPRPLIQRQARHLRPPLPHCQQAPPPPGPARLPLQPASPPPRHLQAQLLPRPMRPLEPPAQHRPPPRLQSHPPRSRRRRC